MEKQMEFTRYEVARILGARALQIAMDAPLLIDIPEDELKEMKYDALKIAEKEFYSGVLPISVKRPMPMRKEERIQAIKEEKIDDQKIIQKEKEIEEEIIEKAEEMGFVQSDESEDESDDSSEDDR